MPQQTFNPNAPYSPVQAAQTAQPTATTGTFDPNASYSPATASQTDVQPGDNQTYVNPVNQQAIGTKGQFRQNHPVLAGIDDAVGGFLDDAQDAVHNAEQHPVNAVLSLLKYSTPAGMTYDKIKEAAPVLNTYENARSKGMSVKDSLSAANDFAEKHDAAKKTVDQAIADWKKNPSYETSKRLTQTAGVVAALVGTGGEATPELEAGLEGTAVKNTLASTAEKTAVTSATENAGVKTAENVATKNAAKSGLTEGTAAQTEAPTLKSVQSNVQSSIRDSVNQVAKNEGLQPVQSGSIRDVAKDLGDQFYARSKDTFAKVQETTGVDLNNVREKISTLEDKIVNAVDDPEKASALEKQKETLEQIADGAFNDARAKGLDVDQARNDWKKFNASYDLSKQIRVATDGRAGIGAGEIVDPNKLSPRITKLMDANSPTQAGRLQQFMGEDVSNSLANSLDQSRGAIRDFTPTSATGQKALQELIQPNTGTGAVQSIKQAVGFAPKTNWFGVAKDFNKLSAEELAARFGAEAPQARSFINSQVRWQVGKMIAKGLTTVEIGKITGMNNTVLHLVLGGE